MTWKLHAVVGRGLSLTGVSLTKSDDAPLTSNTLHSFPLRRPTNSIEVEVRSGLFTVMLSLSCMYESRCVLVFCLTPTASPVENTFNNTKSKLKSRHKEGWRLKCCGRVTQVVQLSCM